MKRTALSRLSIVSLVVAALWLSGGARLIPTGGTALPPARAVLRAWTQASRIGHYSYATDILQTTTPLPLVVNAGRGPEEMVYHVEGDCRGCSGETDVRSAGMHLSLWQDSAGGELAADKRSGIEIKVEGGAAYGRSIGAVKLGADRQRHGSLRPCR